MLDGCAAPKTVLLKEGAQAVLLKDLLDTVAACSTYGCSLRHLRLQFVARTVAACATYGCSLRHLRLQVVLLKNLDPLKKLVNGACGVV